MKVWKKATQTLGDIWSPLLMGVLLGTTTVLFIKLPISPTNDSTLGESIFGKRENLKAENVESPANQTGEDITEALTTLNETLESWARRISPEKYSPSTEQQVESIMKKLDNSSSMKF
mgnify:CR=1 FL=1